MPPRKKIDKDKVIGVIGLGEASDEMVKLNFDDYTGNGQVKVIVLTTEPVTDSTLSVLDWADDNAGGYDAVIDGPLTSRDGKAAKAGAVDVIDGGDNPVATFVETLAAFPRSETDVRIWALWDAEAGENDGHAYDVIELALAEGIPCYDLTNNLEEITLDDGIMPVVADAPPIVEDIQPEPEPEPEIEPEPEPVAVEPPPVKRGRGRPRKNPLPEPVVAAQDDEPIVIEEPAPAEVAAAVEEPVLDELPGEDGFQKLIVAMPNDQSVSSLAAQLIDTLADSVAAKVAELLAEQSPRATRSSRRKSA